MSLFEKPLKIFSQKPKSWSQPCKNMLKKQTQPYILSQPEKRVKINKTIANTGNLETNSPDVIKSITTHPQKRLDRSYNLS